MNPEQTNPLFILTMGDPAGIGPEIAVKTLHNFSSHFDIAVLGDLSVLIQAAGFVGLSPRFNRMLSAKDFKRSAINVIDAGLISPGQFEIGKAQPQCGKAAFEYITRAIDLAMRNEVAGVITNPISKESLKMAGINYPGHTEIFADKTGTSDFTMLFLLKNVGVAHVTTHCSLKEAIILISKERVLKNIHLLHKAMKNLGIEKPRIAVGGLNPHAGENGLFGDEEINHISPAIEHAISEGINASGPYPPDTIFMRAFKGEFDGVVSMLHDHGFVALKSLDFEHGVNITTGLPIIRTSVGHGTAFNLAGSGEASTESLKSAMNAAYMLYSRGRRS
ncbi:MAG: 4-hydroxythreonine-4-phosphate dehydrogenase PdxA [Fibrobacter sp.]|nr:4-hydroxythreonine-4-phosphate dehydrogenase PdxA [Fibrobacter sp.]